MIFLNLKRPVFQGFSAYLECFVTQIRTPLLERLHITLFNQITFALPLLSHPINITEAFELPAAMVSFGNKISPYLGYRRIGQKDRVFVLRVMCKQSNWQIDCAAQICYELLPLLSGVRTPKLDPDRPKMPTECENGEIDGSAVYLANLRSSCHAAAQRGTDFSGHLSDGRASYVRCALARAFSCAAGG